MQTLIENGIAFIIALQSMGDWVIIPMRFFSYLGTEDFFFIFLPLLYWCVDASLGLRVGLILVTSSIVNYSGKLLFAGPRPYWVSAHVRALWSETTFGAPSGHAQHAVVVWGIVAAYGKKKWMWVAAILTIFLIGFSRIYLGSHFPHDVILGWLFGSLILSAFIRFWDPLGAWISRKTFNQQALIALVVSFVFIAIGLGAVIFRSNFQIPETWINNTLLTATDLPDPVDVSSIFTAAGTFFGLAVGAAWIMSLGGYQASGPLEKRALRYIVGLVGVILFWSGLGSLFPHGDGLIVYSLRFIRYALVGWWLIGGAPWVFIRLNLAGHSQV